MSSKYLRHTLLVAVLSSATAFPTGCSTDAGFPAGPADAHPRSDARVADANLSPDAEVVDAPVTDAPIVDAPSNPDAPVTTGPDARVNPDAHPTADAHATPDSPIGTADTGVVDAPSAPADVLTGTSAQIAAVRATADGTGLDLPITSATVTYLKPTVGDDQAGFFIQAEQAGPAVFIQVDPATLTGNPQVGDQVSFAVTAMGTLSGLREALSISGFSVTGHGSATGLVQDIGAVDFHTDSADTTLSYESELVSVTGTLSGAFSLSGGRHDQISIDTTGTPGGTLRIRLPDALRDVLDLESGCTITVPQSPLWRFGVAASVVPQVLIYQAADVTITKCPTPTVVSAVATDLTHIAVRFDRRIQSPVPAAAFTLDGGLTVSAAAVSGTNPRLVLLTTSTQNTGAAYNVTVGTAVTDTRGTSVGTPNTAALIGFDPPATLVLNELAPNITGGHDLVELRAQSAGNIFGFTLEQDVTLSTILATLPAIHVAAGDIIVVHLKPSGTTAMGETDASGEAVSSADNYDTAWDVLGNTNNLTYSNRVITIRSGVDGQIQDAVALFRSDLSGTPPAGFPWDVTDMITAQQWTGTCASPVACTYTEAKAAGVDWKGAGTSKTGATVFRSGASDTNANIDWTSPTGTTETLGAPNQ